MNKLKMLRAWLSDLVGGYRGTWCAGGVYYSSRDLAREWGHTCAVDAKINIAASRASDRTAADCAAFFERARGECGPFRL